MWIKLRFFKKNSGCGLYTGALNRPKITVLCMKLPDFSAQRCNPCHTLSSSQTADLLSKAYSHPENRCKEIQPLSHTVFLTDCRSAVQSLQSPREQMQRDTTPVTHCLPHRLQICCPKPTVTQRTDAKRYNPCHTLSSSQTADLLSKAYSHPENRCKEIQPLSHTVFLTDCRSAVQSLQSPREQMQRDTTPVTHCLPHRLQICCPKPTVTQRTDAKRYNPCHTLSSSQTADLLSKAYSHPENRCKEIQPLSHTVFLTDCRSAVQSLQSPREQMQRDTTPVTHCLPHRLQICCPKPTVTQRTDAKRYNPCHTLSSSQTADLLSKAYSHPENRCKEIQPLSHTVFLTDCRSAVQSLQSPREQMQRDTTPVTHCLPHRLQICCPKPTVTQRTDAKRYNPCHTLSSSQTADLLSKAYSHPENRCKEIQPLSHTVFLTDCRSAVQSLQSPREQMQRDATPVTHCLPHRLQICCPKPTVTQRTDAKRYNPCHTLSSSQTADLLSKAYSHPENRCKEIHSAVSVTCHNLARSLSTGSLLTVGSQETRRRIVLPSQAVNKSSPSRKSLMERPENCDQAPFSRKWMQTHSTLSDDQMHHHATNRPPSSAFVMDTTICAPIYTTLPCLTHQTAHAKQPCKPQSICCSLVPCKVRSQF